MNLDSLKTKADKDTKIDVESLDLKSIQLPYITSDWLKILNAEALHLKKLDADHNQLRGQKFHFFKNNYNVIIKSSSDVNEYIRADDEFKKSLLTLQYQEEKVKFIEGIISALNTMSFNISNAIKWNMFKSGGA